MWQKIKCWLGFHTWTYSCNFFKHEKDCNWYSKKLLCETNCIHLTHHCKYCGRELDE